MCQRSKHRIAESLSRPKRGCACSLLTYHASFLHVYPYGSGGDAIQHKNGAHFLAGLGHAAEVVVWQDDASRGLHMRGKHNGWPAFADLSLDYADVARGEVWQCLLLFAVGNSSLYDNRLALSKFSDFNNVRPAIRKVPGDVLCAKAVSSSISLFCFLHHGDYHHQKRVHAVTDINMSTDPNERTITITTTNSINITKPPPPRSKTTTQIKTTPVNNRMVMANGYLTRSG